MLSIGPIPTIVASTVAVADRRISNQSASGFYRAQQFSFIITSAGAHASFVATIEGSPDGARWYNLGPSVLNTKLPAGITIDQNGIAFSAALGTAGFVLMMDVAFAKYRLGLAGSGAPGGAGIVEYRVVHS